MTRPIIFFRPWTGDKPLDGCNLQQNRATTSYQPTKLKRYYFLISEGNRSHLATSHSHFCPRRRLSGATRRSCTHHRLVLYHHQSKLVRAFTKLAHKKKNNTLPHTSIFQVISSGQNRVPILEFPNKILKWKFSSILYHHLIHNATNVIKLFKNDHITKGRYIFDQTLLSMIKH
jgi:hypothetical protein